MTHNRPVQTLKSAVKLGGLKRVGLALAWGIAFVCPAWASSISFWQWGGVELRLEAEGDSRNFLYERLPSDLAAKLGISPGATLFEGKRSGNRVAGTGYVYAKGCPPLTFQLGGPAKLTSGGELVLKGFVPQFEEGTCNKATEDKTKTTAYIFRFAGKSKTFKDME